MTSIGHSLSATKIGCDAHQTEPFSWLGKFDNQGIINHLQVECNLDEEGSVGVRLDLDDVVLLAEEAVGAAAAAVPLLDQAAGSVDLPEAAQADAAPYAPLNAPEEKG